MVELDGAHHSTEEHARYDQARTEHLEQYGYRVIRFPNVAVLNDLDTVLEEIRIELDRASSPA